MQKDEKAEALESLLGGNPADFCADWLEAIEQAGEEEKSWRCDKADEAVKAFKGDPSSGNTAFNIFHSNIETLVPALYNSSPIPDVRRRFNDDDMVAAQVSTLIERAISFSIDDYDFDDTMKTVVKDMTIVDRGIARIKYEPTFGNDGRTVTYEEAPCDYVPWGSFRRGPATQWRKVPWIAFAHFLDRKEVEKLVTNPHNSLGYDGEAHATIMAQLTFAYSPESKADKTGDTVRETPKFGKREMVWEVWDKDTRTVVWLSQDYADMPLAVMEDPLELKDFFPTPRPAQVITSTDSLVPITSYEIYVDLIKQLNAITERIDALVDQIRVRGGYAGVQEEVELIAKADDGELVPLNNAEMFATTGGDLNKLIVWWPLEMIYKALEVLVQQREVVKATIYEVTGLADIIRGATDPGETATAQGIKEKWGSIRVQGHQKEVERYARDLFRLKAEVYCRHFSMDTLLQMTGLKFPTAQEKQRAEAMKAEGEQMFAQYQQQVQAAQQQGLPPPEPPIPEEEVKKLQEQIEEILGKPTIEEIEQLMRDARVLKYRVDIESDSTVRADLTKNQEQMKGFLDGTAAYAGAVGPMVQEGIMPGEVAVTIFSAFARNFRLGKQAEDALDEWAEKIKKAGVQGKPPDPNVQAEADLKVAQAEKTRAETQILPQQFQLDAAKTRADVMIQSRQAENADNAAANEFEFKKRSTGEDIKDRRAERGLKHRQINDANRHAEAGLAEQKAAREQSEKMERMKLTDGRQARREGYHMTAQTQPPAMDGEGKPLPPRDIQLPEEMPLEEGPMTSEEQARMAQSDQLMQGVVQGLQAIAETQAQQAQAMAQAIEALTAAISAPKVVIRDQAGRAVGVEPATGG